MIASSHWDYLKAANIAPIMIETREESGITRLIGQGRKFDDESVWVDAKLRTKIINLAMRIAGRGSNRETVIAALNIAAHRYNAKLTPHLITLARAARLSEQLDKILDEMKRNGQLKHFHKAYAQKRIERAKHGAGFMNFATAERRFRNAIIARLVGNVSVSDSGLIEQVLSGKVP